MWLFDWRDGRGGLVISFSANRPLKKRGLNVKWPMVDGKNRQPFHMCHLPFALQDAFFSILPKPIPKSSGVFVRMLGIWSFPL
jgi:hypothetical protein